MTELPAILAVEKTMLVAITLLCEQTWPRLATLVPVVWVCLLLPWNTSWFYTRLFTYPSVEVVRMFLGVLLDFTHTLTLAPLGLVMRTMFVMLLLATRWTVVLAVWILVTTVLRCGCLRT